MNARALNKRIESNQADIRAVAYYRRRHIDPKSSQQSISEQHNSVAAWIAHHPNYEVIAEYIEDEIDFGPRNALKSAIDECRKKNAFLLIASTEAIGQGPAFHPRIFSVPFISLPAPPRALGYIRPSPLDAPVALSLYFDDHAKGLVSNVYLCNGMNHSINDVTTSLFGATANLDNLPVAKSVESDVLVTSTETRHVRSLFAKEMSLISNYDVIFDGDFLLICDIAYQVEEGSKAKARTIVDKGYNGRGFVRFGHPENAKAIPDIARTADRTTNLLSFH